MNLPNGSSKRKISEVDSKSSSPDEASFQGPSASKRHRTVTDVDQHASGDARSVTNRCAIDFLSADTAIHDGGWQTVRSKRRKQPGMKEINKTTSSESNAIPEVKFHNRQQAPIRIEDLQNLVLYTLADGVSPSWLAIKNVKQVKRVVVVMVPGLERTIFDNEVTSLSSQTCTKHDQASTSRSVFTSEAFAVWKNGGTSRSQADFAGAPIKLDRDALAQPLQPMADIFNHIWPIRCPGDSKYSRIHSPLQAMLIAPYPKAMENKHIRGPKPPREEKHFKPQPTKITSLVHKVDELRESEYPIHPATFTNAKDAALEQSRRNQTHQSTADGWVDSNVTESMPVLPPNHASTDPFQGADIYSLDCEMVLTTDDVYSLARISLVSHTGAVIMDKYVLPSLPIKDYFTPFSGVTPEILASTTTTLKDVQHELLTLLKPSTILLGHSLNSDLCALKITHPFLVDTSIIYPHPRGLPLRSSLKFLAQKYLRREIQAASLLKPGHDSVEDARAVLDLVKLKCEKGQKWGTSEASGEPIWRRLHRAGRTGAIVEYGTPELGLGKEADVAIGCESDAQIVQGIIYAANGHPNGEDDGVDFVWARLRELEFARGWAEKPRYPSTSAKSNTTSKNGLSDTTDYNSSDQTLPPSSLTSSPTSDITKNPQKACASVLETTISHIQHIHAGIGSGSLLIIYSGTGRASQRLSELHAQLNTYKREFRVKRWDDLSVRWTDADEKEMHAECEAVRSGWGWICLLRK